MAEMGDIEGRSKVGGGGEQGVTKRCRLSWMTYSALVLYMSPNERRTLRVSANEYMQLCTIWSLNKITPCVIGGFNFILFFEFQ